MVQVSLARISNIWYDSNNTILGTYFFWYDDSTDRMTYNGQTQYDSTSRNNYTTITTDGKRLADHFLVDTTENTRIGDSVYVKMIILKAFLFGRIYGVFDSICIFAYKTDNFKQIPYPMASKFRDTTSIFILHAPDTVYNTNNDISIRLTKHKQKFVFDSVYVPSPTLFLNVIPNQQTFAPKVFSIASSWYALVGNVHNDEGNIHSLLYRSKFDGTNEQIAVTSSKVDISSCKVREDGTLVAVGKKLYPEDQWKNDDFYLGILRPGTTNVEEYTWGTAFNDLIFDVTFLNNGDIVVSGNAGPNCYVARISTDNPTSVNETTPFSGTIGIASNPVSSQTLVTFLPTIDGKVTAELYDMRGYKVADLFSEFVSKGNQYTFPANVQSLPNGVYTVVIRNGIDKHFQQLLIVR